MPDLLVDHALAHARRGFRVFPCQPNGKMPLRKGWTEDATRDPETIRAWWAEHPHANIGCLTGGGVVVFDLDQKAGHNGAGAWIGLGGEFGTMMVATPSGGAHLYFTTPQDVANSAGTLGDGIDVRGHHGFVIAPGSVIDGKVYALVQDVPLSVVPHHVLARCTAPRERAANAHETLVELDTPAAIHAAASIVRDAPPAIEGERSEAAYKLACKVREQGVSEHMCFHILTPWGEKSGVVGDDLHHRVSNAYSYAQNAIGAKHMDVQLAGVAAAIPAPPSAQDVQAERVAVARSRFKLETLADCEAEEDGAYIVKGALEPGNVASIYGPPNCGKSGLATHLGTCAALGLPFFGRKVTATRTLYIASENPRSIRRRLRALKQRHGDTPDLLLIGATPDLFNDSGDAEAITQIVRDEGIGLVVLDVLADAFIGMDENSNTNTGMGRVVQVAKMWAATGAAVVFVHHVAKDHGGTPRGGSALLGALDWGVLVEPHPDTGTVSAKWLGAGSGGKVRDHAGAAVHFRNEVVTLGKDRDGDPITTVVCREVPEAEIRAERNRRLTPSEERALAELHRLALAQQPPTAAPGAPLPAVPERDWREACSTPGVVSDASTEKGKSTLTRTVNNAINGLVAKVKVRMENGSAMLLTWGDTDPVEFHNRPDPRAAGIVGSVPPPLKAADFGKMSIPPMPGALH